MLYDKLIIMYTYYYFFIIVQAELYEVLDQLKIKLANAGNEHGEASSLWDTNSAFVQPWNFDEVSTSTTKSAPAFCSNLNHVFSPQY